MRSDSEPTLRIAACVAAAAQDADAELMTQLAVSATKQGSAVQVRSVALEALISLQRRPAMQQSVWYGDASQQTTIAELLARDLPDELRQLALFYLAGCSTQFARMRLLELARTAADPLSGQALNAAARSESPPLSLEAHVGEGRRLFERLEDAVRTNTDHKERWRRSPEEPVRSTGVRPWPPPRRPEG